MVGSWAYTTDEMTARATRGERVKRGMVLKSGGGGLAGSKKVREKKEGDVGKETTHRPCFIYG